MNSRRVSEQAENERLSRVLNHVQMLLSDMILETLNKLYYQ